MRFATYIATTHRKKSNGYVQSNICSLIEGILINCDVGW